jgi:hypothetical protein
MSGKRGERMLDDGGWSSAHRWGIRLVVLGCVLLGARAHAQGAPAAAQAPSTTVEVELHGVPVKVTASSVLADAKNPDRYGPANLLDEDPNTLWAEGAKSTGAGEWVELSFPPGTPVHAFLVTPGNPKSSSLYLANARPRKAKLELTVGDGGVLAYDLEFPKNFPVGGSFYVEYRHQWEVKSARLTVVSIWPGRKYRDLCLGSFVPVFREGERTFRGQLQELAPSIAAFIRMPDFVPKLLPPKDTGISAWLRAYPQVPAKGPLPSPQLELEVGPDRVSAWGHYRRALEHSMAGAFVQSNVFRLTPAPDGKGLVLDPLVPPKGKFSSNFRVRWERIAGEWRVVGLDLKFKEETPDD